MPKEKHFLLLCVVIAVLALSGCTKKGKTDEGTCPVVIQFNGMYENVALLDDQMKEHLRISVQFENIATEKEYQVYLDSSNNYSFTAYLNPGMYEITYCHTSPSFVFNFYGVTDVTSFTLAAGQEPTVINATFQDNDVFVSAIDNMINTDEIKACGAYSRKIQIDGRIVDIENILNEGLSVFANTSFEQLVYPGGETTVAGRGIVVSVYNISTEPLYPNQCKVMSVTVRSQQAVLGGGLMLGLEPYDFTNSENGLLGEPYKCSGSLLYGCDISDTDCSFVNTENGDRITVTFNCVYKAASAIAYELEVFE